MARPKYDSDIPEGHAFQDNSQRHPDDILLRANGFRIAARPEKAEAIWECGGQRFTHTEAIQLVEDFERRLP